MSAQIEALRDRGNGRFPCPSCGTVASDEYDYPYCPRGCSEAQMLAALRARPHKPSVKQGHTETAMRGSQPATEVEAVEATPLAVDSPYALAGHDDHG